MEQPGAGAHWEHEPPGCDGLQLTVALLPELLPFSKGSSAEAEEDRWRRQHGATAAVKCPANAFSSLSPSLSLLYISTQTWAQSCGSILCLLSWAAQPTAVLQLQHSLVPMILQGFDLAIPACFMSTCHPQKPFPRKASEELIHQWGTATACLSWRKKPRAPFHWGSSGDNPHFPAFGSWGFKGESTPCTWANYFSSLAAVGAVTCVTPTDLSCSSGMGVCQHLPGELG